ncbi:hypothetical protein J2W92_005182 [Rhizobium leguminosarum]
MQEQMKLKYSWRKTWPDSENDFMGFERKPVLICVWHPASATERNKTRDFAFMFNRSARMTGSCGTRPIRG